MQLFFPMFDIENSKGCLYDRLKVFGTVKFYSTRIECKYSLGKNIDSKTVDVNKILISAKCVVSFYQMLNYVNTYVPMQPLYKTRK